MTAVAVVGNFVAVRRRILALLLLIVLSLSILQVANGWLLLSPLLLPKTTTRKISSSSSSSLYLSNTISTQISITSRSFPTLLFQSKNNNQNIDGDEDKNKNSNDDDSSIEAEWGVSYIGGDPCGSKYNDDPFDANKSASNKPGFPDDMKARIQALAEQKLRERESESAE
ncbi:hypothetical protein FRACYDRAFT_246451 [Fragilariopsis cylindrus CCMP1102]|uniref:Uncharacterized protein n=1 Tax=Fragilariopsis cylindrus CCMP1102 TaxID=635003 RepID=A0A1E7EXD5_9STRA|nr:hypothetical protein FRACYDRAFT_246451 [Fragilariopsis cylindrus CCMP1102]|eukprot:OEU10698.1 hypothetical protein FRACYDRAFT_246451 [Fragilariopsis cylindrus CCMP1102]